MSEGPGMELAGILFHSVYNSLISASLHVLLSWGSYSYDSCSSPRTYIWLKQYPEEEQSSLPPPP